MNPIRMSGLVGGLAGVALLPACGSSSNSDAGGLCAAIAEVNGHRYNSSETYAASPSSSARPRPAHCRPRVRRRRGHHHPRLGHRRYPHQRRGLCTQRIRCPGHPRQRRRRLETRLRPTSQAQQVIPALTASPLNRTTPLEFMTVAWMNAMGLVEHPHMPLSGRGRFPHGAGAQRSPAARRLPMTTQRMPPTASPTSTRRTTNQTMKVAFGTRKFDSSGVGMTAIVWQWLMAAQSGNVLTCRCPSA